MAAGAVVLGWHCTCIGTPTVTRRTMSWNEAYLLAARQGHHLEAAGQSEQGHAIVQCVRCLGMLIGRRGGAAVADERLCHACIPLGAATA